MTAAVGELRHEPVAAIPATKAEPVDRPAVRGLAVTRWALWSLCGVTAWLVLFGTLGSGLQEARAQRTLYQQLRQQLAEATAPVGAPISAGSPVALLSVPRLGLKDSVVVQGTTSRQLAAGPGHLPDSVLPGQAGVSVVYGKALSYGAPFDHLTALSKGDKVSVVTAQGRFDYVVEGTRHRGDVVPALTPGSGRLTLVSAQHDSRWVLGSTVFVDARLAKAAPAGRVAPATPDQAPMRGDGDALVPLVLWLELLLVGALAAVWAARRWGSRQTWIVGAVAVSAALWGTAAALWALLPNLV